MQELVEGSATLDQKIAGIHRICSSLWLRADFRSSCPAVEGDLSSTLSVWWMLDGWLPTFQDPIILSASQVQQPKRRSWPRVRLTRTQPCAASFSRHLWRVCMFGAPRADQSERHWCWEANFCKVSGKELQSLPRGVGAPIWCRNEFSALGEAWRLGSRPRIEDRSADFNIFPPAKTQLFG